LQHKIVIKVTMPNAKSRAGAMVLAAKTNGTVCTQQGPSALDQNLHTDPFVQTSY